MATCKRCRGSALIKRHGYYGESCPDCKGTGEVEDDDSEREGDNTNKGDGDGWYH